MQPLVNIWAITLITFTESIRHKILKVLLVLAAILLGTNIFVTELFTWDVGKVSVEFGLSAASFTGILVIFFLGMKILADDLERNRINLILARPVKGWQYILGKFFGLALLLLFANAIIGFGSILSIKYVILRYPAYIPPNFTWSLYLAALLYQWLAHLVILAVTLFWFSFAVESFVATIYSISSYLIGQNMELLRKITYEGGETGNALLHENIVIVLSWIFPNLSLFDLKTDAAYGLAVSGAELSWIIAYGISYIGILLFFTSFFFNRKEFA
jgi:ABC-type transport system involved in multi-copper enzyme maturation permease subunit